MTIVLLNNNQEQLILIPNEAIRVRVIANSNKKEDIQEKEKIKEDINKIVEKILLDVKDINEARFKLKNNIDLITNTVEKSMEEDNYHKSFTVNYGKNYFPRKEFKGVAYNEGYYESLVITIGEGKGNNYWCVLYPPLCSLDNKEKNTYKIFVKELLSKYLQT